MEVAIAVAIAVVLAALVVIAVLVQRRRRAGGVIAVDTRPAAQEPRETGRQA